VNALVGEYASFSVCHYNSKNLVDPTKKKTMFQWNIPMIGMKTKSYMDLLTILRG